MKMRNYRLAIVALAFVLSSAAAQDVRHELQFPDLPGYQTLACDLHMHTVFSDGSVWPPVRAEEAWRQGLDAISVTDHIEYTPKKDDIPVQHNRPYDLTIGEAREKNLLLARGAEITRDTPPGHFNAIFLSDVEPLNTEDFVEAVKRANEQGAYVVWNHQGWKGPEKGQWLEVHTKLYDNKWFHGMEVANGDEYYPDAHQWCLDKNLTMMGNSDIHAPDLREKSAAGEHRTMTLVFAKDRSLDALKEALFAGRTAVWYKDQIIGRKEWLEPLFGGCIRASKPHVRSKDAVWAEIGNTSDVDIALERTGNAGPVELKLPARTTSVVKIGTNAPDQPLELSYKATNFLVAPKTALDVTLTVPGP
ncbi:MAG: histidinol-phosphatase [Pirellulales bacterium]|nr:histidinol-phosphatase [Pirellulales bacterium]